MKTPFKLKYNTSPLRNKLNSPLKQGGGGRMAANTWPDAAGYHGDETTTPVEKTYFTVPCSGENCPGGHDSDPDVSGHQVPDKSEYDVLKQSHEEHNKKIEMRKRMNLIPISHFPGKGYGDDNWDVDAVRTKKGTETHQFVQHAGSIKSFDQVYKETGVWEGEGDLPAHLEGTYKKPGRFKRWLQLNNII